MSASILITADSPVRESVGNPLALREPRDWREPRRSRATDSAEVRAMLRGISACERRNGCRPDDDYGTAGKIAAGELVKRAISAASRLGLDPIRRDDVAGEVVARLRSRYGTWTPTDAQTSPFALFRECVHVAKLERIHPLDSLPDEGPERAAGSILEGNAPVPAADPDWTEVADALGEPLDSPAADLIRAALSGYATADPRTVKTRLGPRITGTLAAERGMSVDAMAKRLSRARRTLSGKFPHGYGIAARIESAEPGAAEMRALYPDRMPVANGERHPHAADLPSVDRIMPPDAAPFPGCSTWIAVAKDRPAESRDYGTARRVITDGPTTYTESRPGSDSSATTVRYS